MTERQIQRAIISYLRSVLPDAVVHHSVNEMPMSGGNRKGAMIAQANAKADGMLPGFPDILIFHDGRGYCVEVKKEGGRLSPSQKAVGAQLARQGIPYAVCRSVEDMRETLAEWGLTTRESDTGQWRSIANVAAGMVKS